MREEGDGDAGWKLVSYTHLRAHETGRNLVCRLPLEKKKKKQNNNKQTNNKHITFNLSFFTTSIHPYI